MIQNSDKVRLIIYATEHAVCGRIALVVHVFMLDHTNYSEYNGHGLLNKLSFVPTIYKLLGLNRTDYMFMEHRILFYS